MKLASLDVGTRDGQLAVVSRDLSTAHIADGIAPRSMTGFSLPRNSMHSTVN